MARIRCPRCSSLRVEGYPMFFRCKICGFKHDARPKSIVKPMVLVEPPMDIVENGLVCKPALGAWFVHKKGSKQGVGFW